MTRPCRASGIGWAPKIPAGWDSAKVCLVARLESGHTPSRQHPDYWVSEECTIPWFSLADVWQLRDANQKFLGETSEKVSPLGIANSAARILPAGTVVLSRTASVGFSGIMPCPMATTQDFANWVCGPRLLPEYLLWAFRGMKDEFGRAMMGSTHQTIYMPDIRRLAIPVPPIAEQRAIAEFLDQQTTAIDALIERKKLLSSLLSERAQAALSDAVAPGPSSSVANRSTGLEFLPTVPNHWRCAPLKHVVAGIDGLKLGPFGSALQEVVSYEPDACKVYGQENTISGDFGAGRRWLSRQHFNAMGVYELRPGDIVLTRKGSLGNCRMVPPGIAPGIIDSDTVRVRVDSRIVHPGFLVRLLHQAHYVEAQIQATKRGAILSGMNTETVGNLVLALPPIAEQTRILGNLDDFGRQHDKMAGHLERQIRAFLEYRQALITAAVTGQLAVTKDSA